MNEIGIKIVVGTSIVSIADGRIVTKRLLTGTENVRSADAVVLVTGQVSDDRLYHELVKKHEAGEMCTVERIGDCLGPGQIAQATRDGRKAGIGFRARAPNH